MESFSFQHKGARSYLDTFVLAKEKFLGKENCFLGGIFEGYGGERGAWLALRLFPVLCKRHLQAGNDIATSMAEAFSVIEECLFDRSCGTTALVFFVGCSQAEKAAKVIVGNIGDSRAVLFKKTGFLPINREHNLFSPQERKRVLSQGGKELGLYVCQGTQGIRTTRILGCRCYRKAGVVPVPEFISAYAEKEDVIVAGTHSFWDQISMRAVENILKTSFTLEVAGNRIVNLIFNEGVVRRFFDSINFVLLKI